MMRTWPTPPRPARGPPPRPSLPAVSWSLLPRPSGPAAPGREPDRARCRTLRGPGRGTDTGGTLRAHRLGVRLARLRGVRRPVETHRAGLRDDRDTADVLGPALPRRRGMQAVWRSGVDQVRAVTVRALLDRRHDRERDT